MAARAFELPLSRTSNPLILVSSTSPSLGAQSSSEPQGWPDRGTGPHLPARPHLPADPGPRVHATRVRAERHGLRFDVLRPDRASRAPRLRRPEPLALRADPLPARPFRARSPQPPRGRAAGHLLALRRRHVDRGLRDRLRHLEGEESASHRGRSVHFVLVAAVCFLALALAAVFGGRWVNRRLPCACARHRGRRLLKTEPKFPPQPRSGAARTGRTTAPPFSQTRRWGGGRFTRRRLPGRSATRFSSSLQGSTRPRGSGRGKEEARADAGRRVEEAWRRYGEGIEARGTIATSTSASRRRGVAHVSGRRADRRDLRAGGRGGDRRRRRRERARALAGSGHARRVVSSASGIASRSSGQRPLRSWPVSYAGVLDDLVRRRSRSAGGQVAREGRHALPPRQSA